MSSALLGLQHGAHADVPGELGAPQDSEKPIGLVNDLELQPGRRYDAEVPDTLDLAARCALAATGMAWAVSNEEYDYEPYGHIDYDHRTPYAWYGNGIGLVSSPKYAEALPMLRCASGETDLLDVEASFMRAYLARVASDDGLHYMTRVTPLSKKDRPWHNAAYGIPEGGRRITDEDMADMYLNSRHVLALMTWHDRSGDDAWLPLIERAVRGLAGAAIKKDDYAYYPDGGIGMPYTRPRSGWTSSREARVEQEGGEGSMFMYHGGQIRAFARYYRMTGDEEALDMARRLSRYVMKARFWGSMPFRVDGSPTTSANGSEVDFGVSERDFDKSVFERLEDEPAGKILGRADGHWMGHAHGHLSVFRGLLELGHATDDARLIQFVQSGYEFSLWWLSVFAGAGDEQVREPGHVLDPRARSTARLGMFGETCALADLIALAIRLTDYGVADYWDDVDRWVRNNLVERQICDADALRRVSATSANGERDLPDPLQTTIRNVINESLGLYPPNTQASDMIWKAISPDTVRAFVCCSCNGTQALYYAWESIVRNEGDFVQVNLLLNRASPWLDVDSHLPNEGKVVLRNKTATKVRVRMPRWTRYGYVTVSVNGEPVRADRRGNWIELSQLEPGDVVTLEFPMRQSVERIGERTFTFRGHTLCKIEPRSDENHYPLYLREQYLTDEAAIVSATRYAPDATLAW